jgi:hypothetical protein
VWDKRIDARTKVKVTTGPRVGTWRKKRNVDPAYYEQIKATLMPGAPVATPVTAAPAPPVVAAAPPQAAPAPPVRTPDLTYLQLWDLLVETGHDVTSANELTARIGMEMSPPIEMPSFAAICSAYRFMAKVCPEPSRDRSAADMGIRAHAASAAALRTVTRDGGPISINADGLDPEHLAACSVYVADVAAEMRKRAIFGGPNLGIERPVLCELVHPQCWGYVDAWLFDIRDDCIILWDFKGGVHPVDVVGNWQKLCYAAGLVQLCGVGLNHPTLQIEMRIIQPRARSGAPIKRWAIGAQRLAGYVETLSRAAFEAHDNPQCRPGPQCWKCSAGASCPSMDDLCADIAEYLRTPQTRHLNAEQIGVELRRLREAKKALADRLEAVESQAEHMMRNGTHIPDLMLKIPSR